jgi:hypothetical protein
MLIGLLFLCMGCGMVRESELKKRDKVKDLGRNLGKFREKNQKAFFARITITQLA